SISGRDVAVCGNAPSLASEIEQVMPEQLVIAADGATTVLMANRSWQRSYQKLRRLSRTL
ncbi:MAG: hypothetical protein U9Q68_12410, partial [Euryarchaeota archaeon]|nr:hypothetical protein [Euryarchaeota archaeon]